MIEVTSKTAKTQLTQVFVNTTANPLECKYEFPNDPETAIVDFKIKIGDEEIESKLMPKERASEKYSDSIAQGNSAFKLGNKENSSDLVLYLGMIQPSTSVQIVITTVMRLKVFRNASILQFPMDLLPQGLKSISSFVVNIEQANGVK